MDRWTARDDLINDGQVISEKAQKWNNFFQLVFFRFISIMTENDPHRSFQDTKASVSLQYT